MEIDGPDPAQQYASPVQVVHLPPEQYASEAERARWQRRGYATLARRGGHPELELCRACSRTSGPADGSPGKPA